MGAIAFFDLDGTLLRRDSGVLCAVPAARRGLLPAGVAARFVLARVAYKLRLGSRADAMHVGLRCYRGHTLERLRETLQELHEQHLSQHLAPAMKRQVEEHRAAGDHLVLLTASAHFLAEPTGRELRLDEVHGTRLTYDNGLCTGHVDGELLDGDAKLRLATRLAAERGVRLADCAFYSDHIADLPLLEAVGRPVAVKPHPPLARIAHARGWTVLPHDLPELTTRRAS